jgi:repressor LexA
MFLGGRKHMSEREFNEIFAERLRFYLKKYDMTQLELSKRLGVGTTSVYNWCNGIKTPRMDKVDAMCTIFNCKRSDLMNEPATPAAPVKGYPVIFINVLGHVAAGVPLDAQTDIIDSVDIPADWADTGDYFGLRIQGDSMAPNIQDGDIVIVRSQPDVEDGEIAIVLVNGNEGTCKRIKRYADTLLLLSDNPSYKPMVYTAQQVATLPITIAGKVVEARTRF